MKFAVHVLIYASVLTCVVCVDRFFGNSTGYILISSKNLSEDGPDRGFGRKGGVFTLYHYSADPLDREIKAIHCYDNLHSQADVYITGGGIGKSYVFLNFTSEKDIPINYKIEIYSNNKTTINTYSNDSS